MSDVSGWKWWYWLTMWFFPLRDWLEYLLRKPDNPGEFPGRMERLRCRAMGHPAGQIFYNPGGLEPDDRCQVCGDYI